jgi:hypothetical protein
VCNNSRKWKTIICFMVQYKENRHSLIFLLFIYSNSWNITYWNSLLNSNGTTVRGWIYNNT